MDGNEGAQQAREEKHEYEDGGSEPRAVKDFGISVRLKGRDSPDRKRSCGEADGDAD